MNDIERLYVSSVYAVPVQVDGWEHKSEDIDDEPWRFFEAVRHEDDQERIWTLVTEGNYIKALVIDGTHYGRDDYETYFENNSFESGFPADYEDTDGYELNEGALTEEEYNALFEVDTYAEGPMMNYWYPVESLDGYRAEDAAAKLAGTCLVVVEVNGNWGIALSGGGMDLSWEICEAYIALGNLPPRHFAASLPAGGRGKSEDDKRTIAACLRTLRIVADNAERDHERLVLNAQRWAEGEI